MASLFSNHSAFVLDGYLNAGARMFLRDCVYRIVDGQEAGTAAIRAYVKDTRLRVVTNGRALPMPRGYVHNLAYFGLEGRSFENECSSLMHTVIFLEGGRDSGRDKAHAVGHSIYRIEIES